MTDNETIREAIMRLSMCANRECEICKYKDRPKSDLPSEDCKERSKKNVSILEDEFLKKGDNEIIHCIDCKYLEISGCYGECGMARLGIVHPDDYCSRGERKDEK